MKRRTTKPHSPFRSEILHVIGKAREKDPTKPLKGADVFLEKRMRDLPFMSPVKSDPVPQLRVWLAEWLSHHPKRKKHRNGQAPAETPNH